MQQLGSLCDNSVQRLLLRMPPIRQEYRNRQSAKNMEIRKLIIQLFTLFILFILKVLITIYVFRTYSLNACKVRLGNCTRTGGFACRLFFLIMTASILRPETTSLISCTAQMGGWKSHCPVAAADY